MHRLFALALALTTLIACAPGVKTPIEGAMDCEQSLVTVWRLPKTVEGTYALAVDTVDPESSFDPAVGLWTVDHWAYTVDEVRLGEPVGGSASGEPCTHGDHACPAFSTSSPGDSEDLAVVVEVLGGCAGAKARYDLTVTVDGEPARVRNVGTAPFAVVAPGR